MKKVVAKRMIFLIMLAITVFCGLSGCTQEETFQEDETLVKTALGSGEETWAIYWYMCGSDLESEAGMGSLDLEEMMQVELPENVTVVVQTGGAFEWDNSFVDANYLERYVYDSEGLDCVAQEELSSMGDPDTLADFLTFAKGNYPADRTAVVLWNHGGGSVLGVCMDEIFDGDLLTLDELKQAFGQAYTFSEEEPPIEVIGFDACLMATIDTAYTFSDIARYLVASEEMEPGNGWNYTGWLQALSDNPAMDGADLGREICDSYVQQCEEYDTADEITLSVTDLGKIGPLMDAYNNSGAEALSLACEDTTFFAEFGRSAAASENYGGNTPDQGYTNMVDLYDLMDNSQDILSENAQAVMDAIEECVIYKINGDYRTRAAGLSCYYSYNGDEEDYEGYSQIGASEPFIYLYEYVVNGTLDGSGQEYAYGMGYETLGEVLGLFGAEQEDYPVYTDEGGNAVLELDLDILNRLKGIYFQLAYMDEEEDLMILLGRDNDIQMDWDNGIFKDNFRGVWGSLDGYLCYMEIVYEGEDYNLYSVPILLNGEEYNLRVVYDYNEGEYQILGARKGLEASGGVADRNLIQLEPGDVITTLHYASSISGDDDFTQVEVDTISVTEDTSFYETDMGDGEFVMMYELEDIKSETFYSDPIFFTTADGNIYTETELE